MNNKNLFDLLGNDVEDDTVVALPPKEIVKKTTSSKKQDVPPPSANINKANKNKPKATGNEAALKSKADNRSVTPPAATAKGAKGAAHDRKSRSGKTDSSKKLKQGWGDDNKQLETEVAAELDAQSELAADESGNLAEVAKNLKSSEEYFQELKLQQAALGASKKKVVEADANAEVLIKELQKFFEGSLNKKNKSKAKKEKTFVDFDAKFSDEVPSEPRSFNNAPRGGARGKGPVRGKSSNRGRGASSRGASKTSLVSEKTSFPELA